MPISASPASDLTSRQSTEPKGSAPWSRVTAPWKWESCDRLSRLRRQTAAPASGGLSFYFCGGISVEWGRAPCRACPATVKPNPFHTVSFKFGLFSISREVFIFRNTNWFFFNPSTTLSVNLPFSQKFSNFVLIFICGYYSFLRSITHVRLSPFLKSHPAVLPAGSRALSPVFLCICVFGLSATSESVCVGSAWPHHLLLRP